MSLRKQLQAGLGLAMAVIILVLAVLASEAVRYVGEDLVASRLRHDAESLLAALQANTESALEVDASRSVRSTNVPMPGTITLLRCWMPHRS